MDPASEEYAARLDAADPLAAYRDRFVGSETPLVYFDGNSLGRPLRAMADRLTRFVHEEWGGRLIRGWDESWMELPLALGDRLGRVGLGAAPGQVFLGDSTTVLLYKLARAAVGARPGRREVVLDRDNFPTDRFVMEGIAEECDLVLRWLEPDPDVGVTPEQVAEVAGPDTALVLLSHVDYRSARIADAASITRIAQEAGAFVLWDLCHAAGVLPVELDAWGVDLAVGCTYKYLNGGPGSPAFGYVAERHQAGLRQPVQGWMGAADVFAMAPTYEPASGPRRFLSGTPPILGMLALQDTVELLEEVGIAAVREKSVRLTEYAVSLADALLAEAGVRVATPGSAHVRGGHVTLCHPRMREVVGRLWDRDVVPDFREPDGLRIGLSPLSTSFDEVRRGLVAVRTALEE